MSDHINQHDQPSTPAQPSGQDPLIESARERRRKLIKGGLASGPVILTLASRSSFAWHCKSPSGFVSGNNSHAAVADEGTLSPQAWINSNWPQPFVKSGQFYGKTYDGFSFHTGLINYQLAVKAQAGKQAHQVTLSDVMANWSSGGANALGAYILATLLNLKAGKVPKDCLTEAMIFSMFNDCATTGYYVPMSANPGTRWDAQAVINYLRDNWLVG